MEEESPVKPSVAQLAGKLKGHALPMPGKMEVKSMTKSPYSLQTNNQQDGDSDQERPCPHPPKIKIKSSPLIEKLQANLALSPIVLLSPPKSPEAKVPPAVFNPISPCSSLSSTLQPPQLFCEDEAPVSFEQPAEGSPLPSINKGRARLSFKRRLPSRQHRKSASEDMRTGDELDFPCGSDSLQQNGDEEDLFVVPLQKDEEDKPSTSHSTEGNETEHQETDRTEDRDTLQENEDTKVTQTGNEVTEGESSDGHQPSDSRQTEEEEQDDTAEDTTEVKEDKELLETEQNSKQK